MRRRLADENDSTQWSWCTEILFGSAKISPHCSWRRDGIHLVLDVMVLCGERSKAYIGLQLSKRYVRIDKAAHALAQYSGSMQDQTVMMTAIQRASSELRLACLLCREPHENL